MSTIMQPPSGERRIQLDGERDGETCVDILKYTVFDIDTCGASPARVCSALLPYETPPSQHPLLPIADLHMSQLGSLVEGRVIAGGTLIVDDTSEICTCLNMEAWWKVA
jgi:hypothetical protein